MSPPGLSRNETTGVSGQRRFTRIRIRGLGGILELQAPEGGVGFHEFQTDVPSLVITPDHLGFGLATRSRVDQAYAAMQGQRSADNCHAPGVTHVHSNRIRALLRGILVPFHDEFHFGKDALVAAQSRPTFLQSRRNWS